MNVRIISQYDIKRNIPHGVFISIRISALLLFMAIQLAFSQRLHACAMSAMISAQGSILADFPAEGAYADYWLYNDPWDYMGFLMANSNAYANEDGYGCVAYTDSEPRVRNSNRWYKRVNSFADFGNTYYTGMHIEQGAHAASWQPDVLDAAMREIRNRANRAVIVLNHARNATGYTLGNHPFLFEHNGRTFSFMHNGNVNSARAFMISSVNERFPEYDWWVRYPSNHFASVNPSAWVDSEVFFHYLMSYILSEVGDTETALVTALRDLASHMQSNRGSFNFIMSDGERLYAFRNTPIVGVNSHYKLSYRNFDSRCWAVRTSYPGSGDIELKEMELLTLDRVHGPVVRNIFDAPYPVASPLTRVFRMIPNREGLTISVLTNPVSSPALTLSVMFDNPTAMPKASGVLNIYNLKGQIVLSVEINNLTGADIRVIDLGRLSNGIYLCRLKIGDLIAMGRFTIAY